MKLNDIPKLMPVPFGVSGPRTELLESSPAGDRKASYKDGFPPITMLLKSAGGLPPDGGNMNQILFELASGQRWSNAGAGYKFNATFSDVVGGYPKGAQLLSNDGTKVYVSTKDDNKTDFNASPGPDWVTLGDYIGLGNYATKTEVGSKLDKASVLQTTGTSTTSVISQKKVTDELNTKASKEELSSGLSKKVDYGNHTITGGVDSAGNGSVNAANGALRFYRKADGTVGIYSRSEANDTSDYKSEILFPFGKGEACIDIFTFAAGGAKYRDVKSQRKNGVTYTNTQPRPILVIASYDSPATRTLAYVDGVRVAQTSHGSPSQTGAWGGFVSFIVPAGSKYLVNSNGDKIELLDWVEL
ncbi:hypothetical protein [Morganella morganii]|uniref:hypothetical protein n=1 Tax=Morganella morganii TaxID=582 RepID=UPI000F83D8E4|nr:hypothetical protein [Morganella morganii]RTY28682.1 hypothetical protein EKS33_18395 [Morganella morganii subsp. morganii]